MIETRDFLTAPAENVRAGRRCPSSGKVEWDGKWRAARDVPGPSTSDRTAVSPEPSEFRDVDYLTLDAADYARS